MNILLDTNLLTRLVQPGHAQYQAADDAVVALRLQGNVLCVVPQVLYEFWSVATRPAAVNGLGMTVLAVAAELTRLQTLFPVVPDNALIFDEWLKLVTAHQVTGKSAHDARLAAAMVVHGISHLLTFNMQDFARYPGIVPLDPLQVVPPVTPTP